MRNFATRVSIHRSRTSLCCVESEKIGKRRAPPARSDGAASNMQRVRAMRAERPSLGALRIPRRICAASKGANSHNNQLHKKIPCSSASLLRAVRIFDDHRRDPCVDVSVNSAPCADVARSSFMRLRNARAQHRRHVARGKSAPRKNGCLL